MAESHWLRDRAVLVTGATGPLGRALVGRLLEQGARVTAVTRDTAAAQAQLPGVAVRWLQADLGAADRLSPSEPPEVVLHLASYHPAADVSDPEQGKGHDQVTVAGTRALLEAAQAWPLQRLVFASSIRATDAGSDYARAKRRAERLIMDAAQAQGWDAWLLRLASLYGAGTTGIVSMLVGAARRGRLPALPEMGDRRLLLHVADAAAALLYAAGGAAVPGCYRVSDGQVYSVAGLLQLVRAACRGEPRRAPPAWLLHAAVRLAEQWAVRNPRMLPRRVHQLARLRHRDAMTDPDCAVLTGFHPRWQVSDWLHDACGTGSRGS
jgi:nucleoside-diphosphate-sugar epimerase